MTDHANELRRHARKIPHQQGETPGVMLRAADEIERLAARLEAAEKERDALRAKITEMEQQEPVAWGMQRSDGLLLDIITPEEHEAHEGKYTVPLYRHPSPQSQPVARVTGYYAGRCVIEPLDGKTVYPTGMAVYSAPVAAQSAEPVAEVLMHEGEKIIDASMAWMDSTPIGTQLYAAPPSREWAELEDDDVIEIAGRCADVFGLADLISEALRTKNTGER